MLKQFFFSLEIILLRQYQLLPLNLFYLLLLEIFFSDIEQLRTTCKKETKSFLSKTYPKVKEVPVTTKIIVQNINANWTPENVKNFFFNPLAPEDFVSMKKLPANRFVITFKNADGKFFYFFYDFI